MVGEQPGVMPERRAHDELLLQAAAILRTRHDSGGWYDLSPTAASDLGAAFAEIATADDVDGADRKEAIALAHRLLDHDHPELSPMWPGTTG